MKIIKNEKLIKRNSRIGQWTSLGALAVLGIGMYISFTKPELFAYSIGALVVGFLLTQVGMYFGSRWGRSPRPDEKLDAALKGLPGEFTIYHYTTPIPHLLIGPAGLLVLLPYHQRGRISYEKNRWRLRGGGFLQGYMRIFGQEGLGRPELEADYQSNTLKRFLAKHMDETEIPEINAILLFTHEAMELEAGDSPIPAMKLKQLKDFLRKTAKERSFNTAKLDAVRTALNQ